MAPSPLQTLRDTIRQQPISPAPAPWVLVTRRAAGSLLEVGFDRDRELLLVTSSAGRSVIDCETGEKIARDYTEEVESDRYLEAEGIGPLAGRRIAMSGINGGSLPLGSDDGWAVHNVPLAWPEQHLLLVEPGSWLYGAQHNRPATFHKLAIEHECRAFGFSYSGRSLVIASSCDLVVYHRPL
ncbi:hypothetical protein QL104_12720 [Pseudomonas piscis]|uniref:DUF4915 domain-containing protein n=1 Tax=Pseudomonas piscis TaxID=2614538 RepID=A0ABY9NP47_9PSED|nr:hypothetical protein [Pseudomonas piscis]WMN20211.1 hypothetical protein QL104_12720 [Pseudomonas piscis]